jgi:hypothetical protein
MVIARRLIKSFIYFFIKRATSLAVDRARIPGQHRAFAVTNAGV